MVLITKRLFRFPVISSIIISLLVLLLAQYLTYQQYLISKEKEFEYLQAEASSAKDKFRNVLYNDISVANALAIVYGEYGVPTNFDSVAKQISKNSLYVEAIVLTKNGIITNIYPLNDSTRTILGADVFQDSLTKKEVFRAMTKAGTFFAGPRKLKIGGEGIWGEVPVVVDGRTIGFAGVLTRLPTFRKVMDMNINGKGQFAYTLTKNNSKSDTIPYLLSNAKPRSNDEHVSVMIPEGDWEMKVYFSENHQTDLFPYKICVLGCLLSLIAGLFAYKRLNEPVLLKEVIAVKTHEVNERVKELSTIYKLNKILQNEDENITIALQKIVEMMPSGWQYPEICQAKIIFDDQTYMTARYKQSEFKQVAEFVLTNRTKGIIEVVYTETRPTRSEGPFLKEERDLINTISETIQVYFNKLIHQKEVAESEIKFKALVEKSPVGVYILKNRQFVYVNPSVTEKSGYTQEELYNLTIDNFVHPDDIALVEANMRARLKGEVGAVRYDIRAYKKDKSVMWLELHGAITVFEGAPAIIGTMVDVTESKLMEIEREKMVDDLMHRNRDLEQFSFIVSHNIRSPLATILGLANMLKYELPKEEERKVVKGMSEWATKLDNVIKDVNEILNTKKQLMQSKVKIDLNALLQTVVGDMSVFIKQSDAKIEYDLSSADSIASIPSYLHSIFHNLISNGIKYAKPGTAPEISVWSEKREGEILLHFKDNGIGIDLNKHKNELFGLYKKFNFNLEGKGMGLFMVKTQVTALNGTIEVKSELENGTEFIVTFPI